jgi:hypothetical protein
MHGERYTLTHYVWYGVIVLAAHCYLCRGPKRKQCTGERCTFTPNVSYVPIVLVAHCYLCPGPRRKQWHGRALYVHAKRELRTHCTRPLIVTCAEAETMHGERCTFTPNVSYVPIVLVAHCYLSPDGNNARRALCVHGKRELRSHCYRRSLLPQPRREQCTASAVRSRQT